MSMKNSNDAIGNRTQHLIITVFISRGKKWQDRFRGFWGGGGYSVLGG
jgi:hypothetical protein